MQTTTAAILTGVALVLAAWAPALGAALFLSVVLVTFCQAPPPRGATRRRRK